MQIADTFPKGAFPPSQGGDASMQQLTEELRKQRRYHRLIQTRRAISFWWYRLLLIMIAGLVAPFLAPLLMTNPKIIFGGMAAIVVLFYVVRYVDWSILLIAICSTAFFPSVLQIKSLSASPVQPLIILVFCILFVQAVF